MILVNKYLYFMPCKTNLKAHPYAEFNATLHQEKKGLIMQILDCQYL